MTIFVYNNLTKATVPLYPSYIVNNEHRSSEFFIKSGVPEKHLIEWSKQFVNKDSVFIDAGAHMGTYTINLAPNCKQVYAFEPQEFTFYQLCGNVSLNNLRNVKCHNYALGTQEESGVTKELNIISYDGGGSTLEHNTIDVRDENIIRTENVTLKSIDDFNIFDVSFIKIDVEGHELEVIKGAKNTIETYKPHILFECWNCEWFVDKKNATLDYVKSLGYKVTQLSNYPYMFIASFDK